MNDAFETQSLERISAPAPAAPSPVPPRPPRAHAAPKERKPKKGRSALIAVAVAAGAAALVYGAGAFAFSRIYYPNTHIAGVEVSLMTADAAVSRVESASQNYALTVQGNDFSFKFKPEPGRLPVDVEQGAREVLDANEPLAWPSRLYQSIAGTPSSTKDAHAPGDAGSRPELSPDFDTDAFVAELDAAIAEYNEGRSGVFDAASAYDEKSGQFTLERAKQNVKIDPERAIEDALAALSGLVSTVTLEGDDFGKLAGDATDAELDAACKAANELIGVNVDLKMAGSTVASLDGAQMASWIAFDEDLRPSLDGEALTKWAQELDDGLDTVGTERTYTRPDGKVITIGGGTYGWIVDSAALVEAVQDAVQNKRTGDLEVPLKSKGAVFTKPGEKDWAEYIDIDLAEQHARYYDASGKLVWESGCITGNPNLGNATPTGIYRMNTCLQNVTLVGAKDPETGEPEYKTPVAHWMPFVGGAVGLHDASWQAASSFSSPKAYQSVGSHGCVNLPPDKAAELFGLVKSGMCVIVHP